MEPALATVAAPWRRTAFPDIVLAAGVLGLLLGIIIVVGPRDGINVPWYAASAVLLSTASVVRVRRPNHPLAVWLFLLASSVTWMFVAEDVLSWANESSPSNWVPAVLTMVYRGTVVIALAAGVRIFIRFPDGVARDALERRAVLVVDAFLAVALVLLLTSTTVAWPSFIGADPVANPLRIPGVSLDAVIVRSVFDVANLASALGLALLFRRYRRSDQPTRQQIRWLLLPLIAAVLTLAAEFLLTPGQVGQLGVAATSGALGVGIGFGIVRPEGVRADDVLRRSLLWGIVWIGIASVYVAVSAGLGVAIGQRLSVGWTVTMTVIAMIALQPVRSTLERSASHRLFGRPPDPRKAIARLGDSLASTYDLESLIPEIEASLEDGLGVEWAQVRLTSENASADRSPQLVEPIIFDGEVLGVVECGPKRIGSLGPEDAAVLATFAGQAALAVRNVSLKTNLSERTAELAASRARLLRVEEAERRRIERDIHDGVQQGLVALIGQAGLLRRRIRRGHIAAAALVDDLDLLRTGLQRLLVELRDLAAGIHPSVLRDRGLLAAIETLAARHPVAVDVRADAELRDLRLPIEIESAGYYAVAEALANSIKHADASRLTIELAHADQVVSICVGDDGSGFDPAKVAGNGLANLAERINAVGGRFSVETQTGWGTRVSANLPVGAQTT